MASAVGKRWQILIVIALAVTVVDQWTKFLAVQHLTPGIALAGAGAQNPISAELQAETLAKMSFGEKVSAFYSDVKHPCDDFAARCSIVRVVDGFWNHRYVENPGAAWGLLANASEEVRRPFFLFVSVGAIVFIIGFFRKLEPDQWLMVISLSLLCGGAIGNFIDRLHLSYVIDFVDWYVGRNHWPTFNFADAAITGGVGLIMIEWIRDWIRAKKGSSTEAPAP